MISHVVQPGENLWMIAQRYGVSVQQIMRANGISDPNLVFVGTTIRIPIQSGPPSVPVPGYPSPSPGPGPSPGPFPGRQLEQRVDALEREVNQLGRRVGNLENRVRRLEGR
ncbi:LysM peptidoglycan-binding domain-containing protein [Ammoniphilus resinae]|uniref:LysM repeat protein n=1 Tax=Ammoniphilus resinae TaxID=861532 RepID=A0ABS4GQ26_9BACL|nr:LysM domain-containing protein [Ammoniphilus resinae]MBP1932370.1 LysM repeat protein [Ammoniphilus resinae]